MTKTPAPSPTDATRPEDAEVPWSNVSANRAHAASHAPATAAPNALNIGPTTISLAMIKIRVLTTTIVTAWGAVPARLTAAKARDTAWATAHVNVT